MLLSKEYRFIFVHVPKVAGQSITNALMPHVATYWQKAASHILPYRYQLKAYTKIKQCGGPGFMPQPYEDHVSASQLIEEMGESAYRSYYTFGFVRNPRAWVFSNYTYALKNPRHKKHSFVKEFSSFKDYCIWYSSSGNNIKMQKNYLFDDNNKQLVDAIGKQEDLQRDFALICSKLGIKANLPELNVSSKESFEAHYDVDTWRMIGEVHADDIRLLGYE